jgi:hypothetical protein
MTVNRYRNIPIISGSYYGTYNFPDEALAKVACYNIRTTAHDRLDTLAFKYLGSGTYWWVLAMLNNIQWAFDFVPGEILKVPQDVQDVLRLV